MGKSGWSGLFGGWRGAGDGGLGDSEVLGFKLIRKALKPQTVNPKKSKPRTP